MSPSKASNLKLLCDENLPKKVVELLVKDGYDVLKPSPSTPDEDVAKLAQSEKRILVTFDKIFGNIILFPPNEYYGIVLLRIRPPMIETVSKSLQNVLESVHSDKFTGKLFTVTPFGFKVYPREHLSF